LFRVFFDEDALAHRLQRAVSPFADTVNAAAAGRRGRSDADQLAFAAAEERVLVTYNQRHFTRLHGEWMASGTHHAGIVCITDRRANPEVIAAKLVRLLELRSAEEMQNAVRFLNADPAQRLS